MQKSPLFIVLNVGCNDAQQTEATIREGLDRAGCRYQPWAAASHCYCCRHPWPTPENTAT